MDNDGPSVKKKFHPKRSCNGARGFTIVDLPVPFKSAAAILDFEVTATATPRSSLVRMIAHSFAIISIAAARCQRNMSTHHN